MLCALPFIAEARGLCNGKTLYTDLLVTRNTANHPLPHRRTAQLTLPVAADGDHARINAEVLAVTAAHVSHQRTNGQRVQKVLHPVPVHLVRANT
jgi:hypothetical protein